MCMILELRKTQPPMDMTWIGDHRQRCMFALQLWKLLQIRVTPEISEEAVPVVVGLLMSGETRG